MKSTYKSIWPIFLVLAIYTASSQSSLAMPKTGFSYDKLTHFLIFGLLATSILRVPYLYKKGWKGVLLAILITSFYGGLDEFRQMFTANRYVEVEDWVADTSGAILASILYFKSNWYRRTLEKKVFKKKTNVKNENLVKVFS